MIKWKDKATHCGENPYDAPYSEGKLNRRFFLFRKRLIQVIYANEQTGYIIIKDLLRSKYAGITSAELLQVGTEIEKLTDLNTTWFKVSLYK